MSEWKLKIEITEIGTEETLEQKKQAILKALKELNVKYNHITLSKIHD